MARSEQWEFNVEVKKHVDVMIRRHASNLTLMINNKPRLADACHTGSESTAPQGTSIASTANAHQHTKCQRK